MKSTKQMELEDCLWAFVTLGIFFFMGFMFRGCTQPAMAAEDRYPKEIKQKYGDELGSCHIWFYNSGDSSTTISVRDLLEQNNMRIVKDK